jgi:PEP-CTERM motif
MNSPIRKLILPLFSVCTLTWIVGPTHARADLTLSADSSNPTTVAIGSTATFTYEVGNTGPDPLTPSFVDITLFGATKTGISDTVKNFPTTLDVGVTYTFTVDLTLSSSVTIPTPNSNDIQVTVITNDQITKQFSIEKAIENSYRITASAVPEPSTALVAVLGAVAFIAYGWTRRREQWRQGPA